MSTADETITAIIDGDTIAFIAASACQHVVEDEQGFVQPFANINEGRACVDNLIIGLTRDLNASFIQVYLSDPESNWRKELNPSYKANRKELARPLLLASLKRYLREEYKATHWPALEADDVLSVVATAPKEYAGRTIIVGKDKDFRSIPGEHYQIGNVDSRGKPIIETISLEHADWFHLVQTLAGDRIDGYPGCPGIGMERARQIMSDPQILHPEHGVVTRGIRKGQSTTKWVARPARGNLWGCIVSHYQKAGLGEKDALLTARMARLLRFEEYDMDTGAITLWVPPKNIRFETRGEAG